MLEAVKRIRQTILRPTAIQLKRLQYEKGHPPSHTLYTAWA